MYFYLSYHKTKIKIYSNRSTNRAALYALHWLSLCHKVNFFRNPLLFYANQIINPFLNLRILANYDKSRDFSQSWNPYSPFCSSSVHRISFIKPYVYYESQNLHNSSTNTRNIRYQNFSDQDVIQQENNRLLQVNIYLSIHICMYIYFSIYIYLSFYIFMFIYL